ncbi:MAG: BlaI/MecI/CopY family transcriptional regulator [Clostridia bacterium]|nr:BlaI/MecI/CopY family transcriptional regulator [Clostridia bacterium]
MELIWAHEPVSAKELSVLAEAEFAWNKNTTYTVIKRLSERGIIKNENTVVTSLVSKDEAQAAEIDEMVERTFEGSLPAFIAAFVKRQDLSEAEIDAVQDMIDRYRRGENK